MPTLFAASLTALLTARWAHLTQTVSSWLTNPWLISLSLLSIVAFSLLMRSRLWKRRLKWSAIAILLSYWLLISPPVSALAVKGLVKFVPQDSGATADAIVVLTRGQEVENSRYEMAVQLWQEKRAPRIFVTSARNVRKVRLMLESKDLPRQVLSGSLCALTTLDEATSTAAILGPEGVKKIILITDPPHMLRASLTFQGFGFSVIPHPSPLPHNLNSPLKTAVALREYFGLVSYSMLGRFQQQPGYNLENPPEGLVKEVSTRQCKMEIRPA